MQLNRRNLINVKPSSRQIYFIALYLKALRLILNQITVYHCWINLSSICNIYNRCKTWFSHEKLNEHSHSFLQKFLDVTHATVMIRYMYSIRIRLRKKSPRPSLPLSHGSPPGIQGYQMDGISVRNRRPHNRLRQMFGNNFDEKTFLQWNETSNFCNWRKSMSLVFWGKKNVILGIKTPKKVRVLQRRQQLVNFVP